jgi:polyisoprenoid-binding protein YceI
MTSCSLGAPSWLAVLTLGVAAAAAAATLVAQSSEIVFVATQTGAPLEGRFRTFDATINLPPDKPESGSIVFSVDTASVDFPADEVVKELAKPDWFDSSKFPKAEFRSEKIRALAAGRLEVSGSLTIKGRTRPVVVPVAIARNANVTVATGELAIKRLDFAVGSGEWGDPSLIDDQVKIKFKIALQTAG